MSLNGTKHRMLTSCRNDIIISNSRYLDSPHDLRFNNFNKTLEKPLILAQKESTNTGSLRQFMQKKIYQYQKFLKIP